MILRTMTSLAFVALVACSNGGDEASPQEAGATDHPELKLAAVQYKDNKAVLFAGSGEHKEFMAKIVPAVASWFDEQDVGFKSTHYADLPVAEILKNVSETAASISDEGSMAIYFLTHGSPDGYMLAQDRLFRMSEVVAALKAARKGKAPLRRLFVFVETCYSGNQINAFGLVDSNDGPLPAELGADDPMTGGLALGGFALADDKPFKEAIIVTASKNTQVSYVPIFSNALYQSFIDFNYQDNATIRQWLGKVKEHTLAGAPAAQEPMYKGIPDSVLDEKLWMNERKPETGGTAIATDLLANTITPDGISDKQIEEAKNASDTESDAATDDEDGDKPKKKKVKKDESSGESDDDEADDKPKKKKKGKGKKKDAGDSGGNGGGGGCGTVADGRTATSLGLLLCLAFPLLLTSPQTARQRASRAMSKHPHRNRA